MKAVDLANETVAMTAGLKVAMTADELVDSRVGLMADNLVDLLVQHMAEHLAD